MATLKVLHDKVGGTLSIFWGDPAESASCDDAAGDVVVVLDGDERPIGVELITYRPDDEQPLAVELSTFEQPAQDRILTEVSA